MGSYMLFLDFLFAYNSESQGTFSMNKDMYTFNNCLVSYMYVQQFYQSIDIWCICQILQMYKVLQEILLYIYIYPPSNYLFMTDF